MTGCRTRSPRRPVVAVRSAQVALSGPAAGGAGFPIPPDMGDLADVLADKNTVSLNYTEAEEKFGQVIRHAEAGGTVAVRDGRNGRVRCLIIPVPASELDTSWAQPCTSTRS